jgi:hypothetical protein
MMFNSTIFIAIISQSSTANHNMIISYSLFTWNAAPVLFDLDNALVKELVENNYITKFMGLGYLILLVLILLVSVKYGHRKHQPTPEQVVGSIPTSDTHTQLYS